MPLAKSFNLFIQQSVISVVRLKTKLVYKNFHNWKLRGESSIVKFLNRKECMISYLKNFIRKVSSAGQITQFGQKLTIGSLYKEQYVHLELDKDKVEWVVTANHKAVKNAPTMNLSPDRILNMTVFSKNKKCT